MVPAAGERERKRPGSAGTRGRQGPVPVRARQHSQWYARRPLRTRCGAEFTDERAMTVPPTGWGTAHEPRPTLCEDRDREDHVDPEQAWTGPAAAPGAAAGRARTGGRRLVLPLPQVTRSQPGRQSRLPGRRHGACRRTAAAPPGLRRRPRRSRPRPAPAPDLRRLRAVHGPAPAPSASGGTSHPHVRRRAARPRGSPARKPGEGVRVAIGLRTAMCGAGYRRRGCRRWRR